MNVIARETGGALIRFHVIPFGGTQMDRLRNFLVVISIIVGPFAVLPASASRLTFVTTPQADYPVSKLFDDPTSGGFSDYGDRVTGAAQTGKGPGGAYDYSYGTEGGATGNIVASYPGRDADPPSNPAGMYIYNGFNTAPELFPFYVDNNLRRMITLTADPGFGVSLQSFKIDSAGSRSIAYVEVVGIKLDNSEEVLWSRGALDGSQPIAISNTTGKTYSVSDFTDGLPLEYRALAIDYKPVSFHNNYAFDDIVFGQVPEPGSVSLLLLAPIVAQCAGRRAARRAGR
jgi:hypothetical protein